MVYFKNFEITDMSKKTVENEAGKVSKLKRIEGKKDTLVS